MNPVDDNFPNDLLKEGIGLTKIESRLYSSLPVVYSSNYDRAGAVYDRAVRSRLYNRMMWGFDPGEYPPFYLDSLGSSDSGYILDAACGSLAFTADVFAGYSGRPIIFTDYSLWMLKAAKDRMIKICGEIPENMVFIQADILSLPFKERCLRTVISMNVLHCLKDIGGVIHELKRVKEESGSLSATCLVKGRWFGNLYLRALSWTGEVVPRTVEQVVSAFGEADIPVTHHESGNMMYIKHNL